MRTKAALFFDYPIEDGEVFGQGRRQTIEKLTDLYPQVVNAKNFDEHASNLGEVQVVFATWGMPRLSASQWSAFGSVQSLSSNTY